jgi:hypothetical protein
LGPLSAFNRCRNVANTSVTSGRDSNSGNSTEPLSLLPLLQLAAAAAGVSATPLLLPLLLLLLPGMGAQGSAALGTNHSDSLLMNCLGCVARIASQSTCTAQHSTARQSKQPSNLKLG